MAERDKVIKSGQVTLPRILFLALVGGIIVFTVYKGGIFLSIGYWALTIAICGLLFLVAINYGVKMDKVAATAPGAAEPALDLDSPSSGIRTTMGEATRAPRPKRRASRPAKRRR
jgi:hypothetical protein